jgi:AMP phosphorylase
MSAFVLTQYFQSLAMDEIDSLTRALAESGDLIDFPMPVYDKHSIGGVPGNKISLLIVPIVAAAGLAIPKTSTRAVTSAAGTADVMEVLAPVEFTAEELKEIVLKTKGALVWAGGKLNLSPAVDKIIANVAFPLGIDPRPLMMSGIMAKKLAIGADFVVLDVPVGGRKIPTMDMAREYARTFVELAERLNIRLEAALTYGKVPVGHSIGPALEAREALDSLMGKGPTSLVEKSINLAGILFESAGLTTRGRGSEMARKILDSGKAYEKMREIIEAQGGNPDVQSSDIPVGSCVFEWEAPTNGWVVEINNDALTQIARVAGAPTDPGAGVYLPRKKESVSKGDVTLQIFSNSESKLSEAQALVAKLEPLRVEGILIDHIR